MFIKLFRPFIVATALLAAAACVPLSASAAMSEADRAMIRERNDINRSADASSLEPLSTSPKRKCTGFFFHRGSSVPADEQFAKASNLETNGYWDVACSAYDRLVRSFPFSPVAAQAQLRLGRLLEKRGKYKKAFEEYLYMLYFYPESAPTDSILGQMYAIANYYHGQGKESRSIDYFKRIADISPRWRHTPKALLQAGLAQFARKDYYNAAESFDTITSTHPGTEEAVTALEKHALVLHALSIKYPRDDAVLARAIAVTTAALRDGRLDSPDRAELVDILNSMSVRRSENFFNKAAFYDTRRYSAETKIAAYRDYLRHFPNAAHSDAARKRLDQLEAESITKE